MDIKYFKWNWIDLVWYEVVKIDVFCYFIYYMFVVYRYIDYYDNSDRCFFILVGFYSKCIECRVI